MNHPRPSCDCDLNDRLGRIEETVLEARGTVKAGMVFVGALNVLVLPALVWLFSSTLQTREVNVSQGVKIEKLENELQERDRRSKAPQEEIPTVNNALAPRAKTSAAYSRHEKVSYR